jgi:hypothetical protein
VTASDGETHKEEWMDAFRGFEILAFDNREDNSVWLPARTRLVGENFCLEHWSKSSSLIPGTSVTVMDVVSPSRHERKLGR